MREKNYGNVFFTAVWNGVQITCGYRRAIRRVSMIQALFYFSLRISLVSKMVAYIRMEQILFYSARKFRQQLDSEGQVVTFRS